MKHPAPRTPSILSDSTHRLLNMYALAASAAGVGMLALSQPAEAKIVYTPANVQIDLVHFEVPLDLNHDGVNDFTFNVVSHRLGADLVVSAAQTGNSIRGYAANHFTFASRLPFGVSVGPKGDKVLRGVLASATVTSLGKTSYLGPWALAHGTTHGYLGFRFVIRGKVHYGWARLKAVSANSALLTGYAYETIPNKPIITGRTKGPDEIDNSVEERSPAFLAAPKGKPATLGQLAVGAPAHASIAQTGR